MDFEHKLLELLSHAQTFGGSSTDAGVRARDDEVGVTTCAGYNLTRPTCKGLLIHGCGRRRRITLQRNRWVFLVLSLAKYQNIDSVPDLATSNVAFGA